MWETTTIVWGKACADLFLIRIPFHATFFVLCATHLIPRFDPKRAQHWPNPRTVRAEYRLDGYAFTRRYGTLARHQRERLLAPGTRVRSRCAGERGENA